MQTKKSDFATVFSIMNARVLSNEILPIIEFMTRKKFATDQMAEGMILCRPKLIETFPLLVGINSQIALAELDSAIDNKDVGSCVNKITTTWLRQQENSCPYKNFNVPRIKNQRSGFESFLDKKTLGF